MKIKLEGTYALLPGGQKVWIESVSDGIATVRRVAGQWHRQRAVCRVAKLQPFMPKKLNQQKEESSRPPLSEATK